MAKPWEKYQKAATAGEGPWTKYAASAPAEALKDAPIDTPPAADGAEAIPFFKDLVPANQAIVRAAYDLPVPALMIAKSAMKKSGELLERAGGAAAEALGKAGAPDRLSAAAGMLPALPGAIYRDASDLIPTNLGGAMEAGGASVLPGKALNASAAASKKILPIAGKAGTTALEMGTGVSADNIALRYARNAEVKTAKNLDELSQQFPASVNELAKTVRELSGAAQETLSRETSIAKGGISRDSIMQAIEEQRALLGDGLSNANAKANQTLGSYIERLAGYPKTLSQYDVGKFIRDFDHDINWEKIEMAPQNRALQGLRRAVDEALKTMNQKYAEAMIPTAEATHTLDKAQEIFLLKKGTKGEITAGDYTMGKLNTASKEGRSYSQSILEGLKKYTGRDFMREIENAHAAEAFKGGKAQGSRLATPLFGVGTSIGGLVGGYPGAAAGGTLGAATGWYLDKKGHEVAGSLIDQLARLAARPRTRMPSEAFQRALGAAIAGTAKRRTERK